MIHWIQKTFSGVAGGSTKRQGKGFFAHPSDSDEQALARIEFVPVPKDSTYSIYGMADAPNSNQSFVQSLFRHSAKFRRAVRRAAENLKAKDETYSRDLLKIIDGRPEGGNVGHYDPLKSVIVINSRHPDVTGNLGRMHAAVVFEILNAASRDSILRLDNSIDAGHFHQRAWKLYPSRLDLSVDQYNHKITELASDFYAIEVETIEWHNTQLHHKIMKEARINGMEINDRTDRYSKNVSLEQFIKFQSQTGHTASYKLTYWRKYCRFGNP